MEGQIKSKDLKMHLSPHPVALAAVPSEAVIFLLLIYCLMYFSLWGFCVCLCFGMHYFAPFLVLQSS